MARTFTTSPQGRSRRALFGALGLPVPVTHDLNPRERRARTFQQHAAALAAEAVALWQRTRRRIVTLDQLDSLDGDAFDPARRIITFDRFA